MISTSPTRSCCSWHQRLCGNQKKDCTKHLITSSASSKENLIRLDNLVTRSRGSYHVTITYQLKHIDFEQLCSLNVPGLADSPAEDEHEVYQDFKKQLR